MYEDRQEFKILEKIILNINIAAYQKLSRTSSVVNSTPKGGSARSGADSL